MKNESGRSMVEMLGVLAIISILSIVGVAGYKLAMYRYHAGQLIDLTEKFSFLIFDRCRSVFDSHSTALASIDSCTPNTPGIPTFENTGIGNFPEYIYNKSILFKRISLDENNKKYIIHTQLKFKTKEHCLSVKLTKGIKSGCRESSTPYSLSMETIEN